MVSLKFLKRKRFTPLHHLSLDESLDFGRIKSRNIILMSKFFELIFF